MILTRKNKRPPILVLSLLVTALPTLVESQERQISQEEANDIAKVLEVGAGDVIADVGAGYGGWTVDIARKVTETGQIYATEVDSERLEDIRENVTEAGLTNVSVIWGSQKDTGLPPECCDAILLRRVYHHFTDPEAMRESLGRALRPNGVILIIDFEPKTRSWLKRPKSVPDSREGHGIAKSLLIEEMESAGFELKKEINPWHGRDFCFLFRLHSASDVTPDP